MAWFSVCGSLSVLWLWRKRLLATSTAVCAKAILGLALGNPGMLQAYQNHHAGLQAHACTRKSGKWQFRAITRGKPGPDLLFCQYLAQGALWEGFSSLHWNTESVGADHSHPLARVLPRCSNIVPERLFILRYAKVLCAVGFAPGQSLLLPLKLPFYFRMLLYLVPAGGLNISPETGSRNKCTL